MVVESDGVDFRVAAVGAGADLPGLQARVEPAEPGGPVAQVDVVVRADGIDGVLDGRADLFGVAAQADPGAGPVLDPDGVVGADGVDLRLVEDVEAGADLLGVAAQVGEFAAVNADLDVVFRSDGVERVVRHEPGRPGDCTGRRQERARLSSDSISVTSERERLAR